MCSRTPLHMALHMQQGSATCAAEHRCIWWSRALFSTLCGVEQRTLLRFMWSGAEQSSPLYVEQSRAVFSAVCGAEKCTLLCFMCSGAVHSSPLYVQWSRAVFSALCAVE